MMTLPTYSATRRGIATLEFVLALPVLLLLMVAITWLGFSVIGQTQVLVEARNKTWEQRYKNSADNPLSFPILPEHHIDILPKYIASEDFVTEKASKKVEVSPIFNGIPGPQASHTILAGSWDYEAMPFDSPPDFRLMAKAAVFGAFGNVLDLASSANDPLGLLGKVKDIFGKSKRIQSETDDQAGKVGKDDSPDTESGSGSGTGPGGEEITPEEGKAKSEADLEEHKKQLKEKFKDLGGTVHMYQDIVYPQNGKLQAAQDAIRDAQSESAEKSQAARNETDEEKKKQLQEEAARAHRKVELARIAFKRLELECLDTAKEAEGLELSRFELNQLVRPGWGFGP